MPTAADWVDWAMAAIVVLSVAIGLMRGFIYEVLALVGWIAALVLAAWAAPWVESGFGAQPGDVGPGHWMAFVVCFIVALLLWKLAARAVRSAVQRIPVVGGLDRLLGGAFGFARALVALLAVTVLVRLTPVAQSTAWQRSTGAVWLVALLQDLRWALPRGIDRRLGPCDDAPGKSADCQFVRSAKSVVTFNL